MVGAAMACCPVVSVNALVDTECTSLPPVLWFAMVLLLVGSMQNLREAIATYRGRLMAETKESRRATLMAVCIEYLER